MQLVLWTSCVKYWKSRGFLFYNNVAISAKYIQEKYKLSKILSLIGTIIMVTQQNISFMMTRQFYFFQLTINLLILELVIQRKKGLVKEKDYNINVHLPCNTTNYEIIDVFKNILVPKLTNAFKPQFILISSGFDSRINDLLGCYKVNDEGFVELTKIIKN